MALFALEILPDEVISLQILEIFLQKKLTFLETLPSCRYKNQLFSVLFQCDKAFMVIHTKYSN